MSSQRIRWHRVPDLGALQDQVAKATLEAARQAISARGQFSIVLSGGETPRGLYEGLRNAAADWAKWRIFFGDERCVSPASDARNSRMARLAWLDHVGIANANISPMRAELGPDRAARLYERLLTDVGDFDLVLLGLGEDGHVGSLFPGAKLGAEEGSPMVLPVLDAPKPPPHRVTLSANRFSRARQVFFLVAGATKREAISRWRSGRDLPAAAIKPSAGIDVYVESALMT